MRERHLRYVTVLTWLACMVTVGVAAAPAERPLEATAVHPVVGAASDACLIPAGFLQGLVASQPEDAFAVLFLAFPIDPSAQTRFRERVLSACERVGPVTGFDLLGCRSLPDCTRYFQILFLTHHPVQPVAWEFTMYRPRPEGSV